jgi:hypothetical protein
MRAHPTAAGASRYARSVRVVPLLFAFAGCGRLRFDPAAADAAAARADGLVDSSAPDIAPGAGPWGNVVEQSALDIGVISDDPTLTGDELEIYFNSNRDGTGDIFMSTRASIADAWSTPQTVVPLSSPSYNENTPEVSADGLELYFIRDTTASGDVYVSTRALRTDAWSTPTFVPELTTVYGDASPTLTADRLTMYLANDGGTNGFEVYRATRNSLTSAWSAPAPVSELSSAAFDSDAFVTTDGTELYWSSTRNATKSALWHATRASAVDPFASLGVVTELDLTTYDEDDPWVSSDGHRIYFSRGMTQSSDMKIVSASR